MSLTNEPRNALEAYERIVPSAHFYRLRDGVAEFLAQVRTAHPHVNPVMLTMEYILEAETVHQQHIYAGLSGGHYETAIDLARQFFVHVTKGDGLADRNMARLEFDAMRRWAVPGAREGAEVFWLAEFTMLYSAPFDNEFLNVMEQVYGRTLGHTYTKTFARGSKEHDAIARQFNQLMTHVKFFTA